jgi:hypothetical protein
MWVGVLVESIEDAKNCESNDDINKDDFTNITKNYLKK